MHKCERKYSLCNRQQIIPVYTFVFRYLIVRAYPACVDHYVPNLISLGIQEIITF